MGRPQQLAAGILPLSFVITGGLLLSPSTMLVLGHTEFQSSRLWSECTDHWATSPSPYVVICVLIWMISWPLSEISGRGDLMCVECLCSCPLPSLTAVAWVSKGGNTPCSSLGRQNFLSHTVAFIMKSWVTTYFMAQLTFLLPRESPSTISSGHESSGGRRLWQRWNSKAENLLRYDSGG